MASNLALKLAFKLTCKNACNKKKSEINLLK